MPRRRPGYFRTGSSSRRTPDANPIIGGLSSRALSEIRRLEHTRNYLQPGDVNAAVCLWQDYVHRPQRELWHDSERGNAHWYCCGNPFEARDLLDTVMPALSPRSARELRKVIGRYDAIWNRSSPPFAAGE